MFVHTLIDVCLFAGIVRLFADLSISLEAIEVLVFAWKLEAKVQGEFSDREFVDGLTKIRVDKLSDLKNWIHASTAEIQSVEKFKYATFFSREKKYTYVCMHCRDGYT